MKTRDALLSPKLWLLFFFFLGENPLEQEEDHCGVSAAPASLPPLEQLFRPLFSLAIPGSG